MAGVARRIRWGERMSYWRRDGAMWERRHAGLTVASIDAPEDDPSRVVRASIPGGGIATVTRMMDDDEANRVAEELGRWIAWSFPPSTDALEAMERR